MGRRWAVTVTAALVLSTIAGVGVANGATTPAPPAPLAAGDPVVAAAGDIACAPPARRTSSGCHHRDTSDLLVAGGYDAVLPLGDLQYECGQASAYRSVYDPTWGRVKAVTHPAVGDNEYSGNGCSTSGASGYFGYFGSAATPRQPSCRTAAAATTATTWGPGTSWCSTPNAASPGSGAAPAPRRRAAGWPPTWPPTPASAPSPTGTGRAGRTTGAPAATLDATSSRRSTTPAPRSSSTATSTCYERFAPQTPAGVAGADGIRQFAVGTGGKNRHGLSGTAPRNAQARSSSAFGVLALTLHPTSYDWRFVSEAGRTFTDSGSHPCH